MTPEPRPCPVSICTTEGSSALATAATGSSPALICDGVTATGMPDPPEITPASELPRSRSWPIPKPAPSSSTTATAPATRREVRRLAGGRPLPAGGGGPHPGPVPDGSGIGRVSSWLHGDAVPGAAQEGPGAQLAGPPGAAPDPAPQLPPVPSGSQLEAPPQLGSLSRSRGAPRLCPGGAGRCQA